MKPYKGLIPWISTGPLDYFIDYTKTTYNPITRENEPIVFKENSPFVATLAIKGIYRGRSAAGFIWESKAGQEFIMRLACMEDLLLRGSVHEGVAYGTWAFAKQGANFSLMLVKP